MCFFGIYGQISTDIVFLRLFRGFESDLFSEYQRICREFRKGLETKTKPVLFLLVQGK